MGSEITTLDVARARTWLREGRAQSIRERSGLSQSDLARTLGVATTTVSRWEAGTRLPRPLVAVRLIRLLDRLESPS